MDNAKGVLMLLVVFGHALELAAHPSQWLKGLYFFIYLFHMPAFAFVSGYFSRPEIRGRKSVQDFLRLFTLYVFFQLSYSVVMAVLGRSWSWSNVLFHPYWILWYLVSLICWKLLLPVFARGWPGLLSAFVTGVAVGYLVPDGSIFSVGRTLVFFPFFLLGYRSWRHGWVRQSPSWGKLTGAVLTMGVVFFVCQGARLPDVAWLYGRTGFAILITPAWGGGLYRGMIDLVSCLMVWAFLVLVPRRESWISGIGRATLPVFLWHGMLLKVLDRGAWLRDRPPLPFFLASLALSFGVVFLLSRRWIVHSTEIIASGGEKILSRAGPSL